MCNEVFPRIAAFDTGLSSYHATEQHEIDPSNDCFISFVPFGRVTLEIQGSIVKSTLYVEEHSRSICIAQLFQPIFDFIDKVVKGRFIKSTTLTGMLVSNQRVCFKTF